jgi:hypothetical protein
MIKGSLTPETAAEFAQNLSGASDATLEVARILQRLAFSDPSSLSRLEALVGDFVPASLYISQATALRRLGTGALIEALKAMERS